MSEPSLDHALEAILFVATEPLSVSRLSQVAGADTATVEAALERIHSRLQGGIRLSRLDDKYRLVTAPDTSDTVRAFLQDENKTELSRPALETLAIVAYRGPLTKTDIEGIRGVASDTMLRNLLGRGLITEAGKSDQPGRPPLYAVSHGFLQHFGLTSPADLPPIPDAKPPAETP